MNEKTAAAIEVKPLQCMLNSTLPALFDASIPRRRALGNTDGGINKPRDVTLCFKR